MQWGITPASNVIYLLFVRERESKRERKQRLPFASVQEKITCHELTHKHTPQHNTTTYFMLFLLGKCFFFFPHVIWFLSSKLYAVPFSVECDANAKGSCPNSMPHVRGRGWIGLVWFTLKAMLFNQSQAKQNKAKWRLL